MSDSTDPGRTGDGFDDPTAPAWASPEPRTDPADPHAAAAGGPAVAVRPPQPAGALDPGRPATRTARTRTARPRTASRPVRPQPPSRPGRRYGQAQPATVPPRRPYGQPPYGSTAYGQPPYSLPPAPYGAPPAKNTSAIVLTVISAVTLVACCNVLAIPSLILGILGLTKAGTDPQGSARMTQAGWITFGGDDGPGRHRLGGLLRPGRLRRLRRLHLVRLRGALSADRAGTPDLPSASQQTSSQLTGSRATLGA